MSTKLREKVYQKCGGKCGYCGCNIEIKNMQIDHIIPKRNFVSDIVNKLHVPDFLQHLNVDDVNHIDNLMPSCRSCNHYKDSFYLDRFRSELCKIQDRLKKNTTIYNIALRYGMIEEREFENILFYFEYQTKTPT